MTNFKKRILIVDDEENVTMLLNKVLRKEGYITDSAATGKIALEKIEKNTFDIVITDIKMPEMDGISLLKEINALDCSIKVILITAFATVNTAIEALRFGAADYITKPFDIAEILNSVNKASADLNSIEHEIDHISYNLPGSNLIKSKSPSMKKVIQLINQVADANVTVLIQGETGTGKELVAQSLHQMSSRSNYAMIKCNCTAIPESLLESELFGHEKGAFTGAVQRKPGRFELADKGTLFLDEIADLPLMIQSKLLRAIQEKEFERLGGIKTIKTDVRIITATNKNLEFEVKSGRFREDLYYSLNVVSICLPPLRERKEDLPDLTDYLLKKSAYISKRPVKSISTEVYNIFTHYTWPGNIRELENVIERCVVVSQKSEITIHDLPDRVLQHSKMIEEDSNLDNFIDKAERNIIIQTLRDFDGNRTKASAKLGISRRSLHRKLIKYQIEE